YERLLKLIKEKWWTRADLMTDDLGNARFRGFGGRYRITVKTEQGEQTQEVDVVAADDNSITVRLPSTNLRKMTSCRLLRWSALPPPRQGDDGDYEYGKWQEPVNREIPQVV